MQYTEASNFITSIHNFQKQEYLKDKKEAEIYLKRLQALLNLLGNPEKKIPHFIHVTGTSGKGSVSIILNSILEASGKKVGLLTSPHPSSITERWEINGREMTKKEFAEIVSVIEEKLDKYLNTSVYGLPSAFEIFTAMGLYYFAKHRVEWVVLEVGCGGRHDSTNVIPKKDIAVITNIGLDHVHILGDSKQEIAKEKSGIIKKGCVAFTTEQNPKILKIIEVESKKQKVPLNKLTEIKYSVIDSNLDGTTFEYKNKKYFIPTLGRHQIINSILGLEIASFLNINDNDIRRGLEQIRVPIRMEVVSKKPLIILDGAHNQDKMLTTVRTIRELGIKDLDLLVGFSANKDIDTMIEQLANLKPKTIICTRYTVNPFRKVADPELISNKFKKILPNSVIKRFIDPKKALDWAKANLKLDRALLATGSMFLSGELRTYFKFNK